MIVKKRYAGDTLITYPDILKYHPYCQGAILSLVYNRSISLKGDRCKEIQDDLKQDGSNVPTYLRSMNVYGQQSKIEDYKRDGKMKQNF